jgi:nitrite reductase/ring-hydroxylating ferredoxin subunit
MPQDLGLVFELARRPRLARNTRGRFPFPIPNGWFIVAASDEVAPGDVVPLYYFGRDLVLFRGADGTPFVLDAYCPHLGAHLAAGGQVEDGCIRCPFHGWKFAGETGRCVEVPYDENQAARRGTRRTAAPRRTAPRTPPRWATRASTTSTETRCGVPPATRTWWSPSTSAPPPSSP